MIPGSGANGPEEMAPSSVTLTGKDSSIFEPIALAFNQSGFHTLQLGKPGVDFFSGWNGPAQRFYDESLYKSLKWKDLLSNVSDAIAYSREQRICPSSSIYLLGHSEGTMVAVDAASSDISVAGLILLGFTGGPYKSIIEWQMYERIVEWFLKRDVDVDQDGFISREEANRWPGAVRYPWRDGQNQVSVDEVRRLIRSQPDLHSAVETFRQSPLMDDGIWERPTLSQVVASLAQPVLAFTGELDVQTPTSEINKLSAACDFQSKSNCKVHILPGLGHAFSPPRPPRAHPLLDATLGPVSGEFIEIFKARVSEWSTEKD